MSAPRHSERWGMPSSPSLLSQTSTISVPPAWPTPPICSQGNPVQGFICHPSNLQGARTAGAAPTHHSQCHAQSEVTNNAPTSPPEPSTGISGAAQRCWTHFGQDTKLPPSVLSLVGTSSTVLEGRHAPGPGTVRHRAAALRGWNYFGHAFYIKCIHASAKECYY